jgi:uncharacterized membrane protein HdeD (DUF308 family)
VLLLNGICAILFGMMAFAWPGLTVITLVFLFGFYCLSDGITAMSVSFAARARTGRFWWQMFVVGLLSVIAGVTAFFYPGITAVVILVIIACWAIMRGVAEIIAAIELRKVIDNEWLLGLAGAVSVLFGLALIARPGVGALAITWMIGALAIIHGVLLVALSLRVRQFGKAAEPAL